MPRPDTAAGVRAFLARHVDRPRNEAPAVTVAGSTATIRLFDAIDNWGEWFGMSAKEFAATIDELPDHVNEIRLLINSPGGDAFDGMAMVNVLRAHPARVVAVVQGLAASAASFIASAADELVMAPNSTLMIHDAWGVCIGNADDMLSMGTVLDQLSDNIAYIYAAKAGTAAEWRERMKAEMWMTANEAVEVGLADSVEEFTQAAASNRAENRPAALAPDPPDDDDDEAPDEDPPVEPPPAAKTAPEIEAGNGVDDELIPEPVDLSSLRFTASRLALLKT